MKFNIATSLSSSFNPVPKETQQRNKQSSAKNAEKKAEIKKKSSKLAKLERQRDKDLIKIGICEFCGKYSKKLEPHEVYGGSNRKRSIQHKFVKLICRECHNNEKIINKLRIDVQKEYEKEHTRQEFIEIIGKSYI